MNSNPVWVLIGGSEPLRRLARQYAGQQGWERIEELNPPLLIFSGAWTAWSADVKRILLSRTQTGDRLVVFGPPACYLGWERAVRRAGRKVDVPLSNLSVAQQLAKLTRWVDLNQRRFPIRRCGREEPKV